MDRLTSIITKLHDSHNHLNNKEIALAKFLIKQSIEDLKLLMTNLESDGTQSADDTSRDGSTDPAKPILAPQ